MKCKSCRRIILILCTSLLLSSCAYVQKQIDIKGLRDVAEDIEKDFNPGNPEAIKKIIKDFSLEKYTKPFYLSQITTEPLNKWRIDHPLGKKLIMEKISFPSRIRHKGGQDTAVFYLYRNRALDGREVILWVPGLGVSDFAFNFIRKFFSEELRRDYDIVFYVPPFHMERTEPGRKNSENFFSADAARNVDVILNAVQELRTIAEYLDEKGVKRIGGWGGSIGAAMLMLAAQMVELDHLCVMIPILDWETVFLSNSHMKEIVAKVGKAGVSKELLSVVYGLINPVQYGLKVNPKRTHIMYAEYDQLTPSEVVANFARKNRIANVVSYKRSHATILLTPGLYKDCGHFLDYLKQK